MTVKELISKLSKLPPGWSVVARGSEGGSYGHVEAIELGLYRPASPWFGQKVDPEDEMLGDRHAVFLHIGPSRQALKAALFHERYATRCA